MFRKDMMKDSVSCVSRFLLAFVWLYAGYLKVGMTLTEAQMIGAYDIFTPYWSKLLAMLIGPLEMLGGFLLLAGIKIRLASVVSAIVLVLFIIGIAQAWIRGLDINCGCFSQDVDMTSNYLLVILRDVGLVIMSMWSFFRPFKRWAVWA